MTTRAPKRPRDPNQLAKLVMDIATGSAQDAEHKRSAMSEIGSVGGIKGGKARAQALSPQRRAEIAARAAEARWKKSRDE